MQARRPAVDAGTHGVHEVAADAIQKTVFLKIPSELVNVEIQRLGIRKQRGQVERTLVLEDRVVHFPELTLGSSGLRCLRCL